MTLWSIKSTFPPNTKDVSTMTDSFLRRLNEEVNFFVEERDWGAFQTPKNLSMALIVEAAELVEHFQWILPEESDSLANDKKKKVAEELADILIYTVRLADRLGIDLEQCAKDKLTKNCRKYPVEKARGKATKYTEL
jgi:NTP pyrophosphatase (non-canonical NTP hydrolase)